MLHRKAERFDSVGEHPLGDILCQTLFHQHLQHMRFTSKPVTQLLGEMILVFKEADQAKAIAKAAYDRILEAARCELSNH
jgi:hypothetical protein